MEAYYMRYFDREKIFPRLISLVPRNTRDPQYDNSVEYISLPQENMFGHLADILKDADIVQFQGSFDPLVCEAAAIAGVPLVVEVLHNIERGGLFREIDISICVSQAVQNAQDAKTPSTVIQNGIDTDEFSFPKERKRSEDKKDKIIFLQVANRSKLQVHLDEIAPALSARFPNLEFWIAGREQEYQSRDNIHFFGVVDHIEELYQAADYLVFFSPNEPFGLAAIEAMSSGCIPLVSKNTAFSDIITEGYDGHFLDPSDNESAIKLISTLITSHHSEKTLHTRTQARKTVEKKFSIHACIKKYEELYFTEYEKVLKKTNPSGKDISKNSFKEDFPSGNAIVGEAVYVFHSKNYPLVYQTLEKIVKNNRIINHPVCQETVLDLFQFAYLNNQLECAVSFISYIINTHPDIKNTAFEKWFSVLSQKENNKEGTTDLLIRFESQLLASGITEKELAVQYLELLLTRGLISQALLFLEKAVIASRDNLSLSTYYTSWHNKLQQLPV